MQLQSLTCHSFRSLREFHLVPGPGINVIRGGNAQGKTTVLEALLYLATSKSHRTANDAELVHHDELGFRLAATIARPDRTVELSAAYMSRTKRFKINGVAVTKVSEILGKVHVVLFAPEDVGLVRGSAADRRLFLDISISQLDPSYVRALQTYRNVIRQRNELLRSDDPDQKQLDAWDAQLVEYGRRVVEARSLFVEELAPHAREAYHTISDDESLQLTYAPDIGRNDDFLKTIRDNRTRDIRRGHTSRGPHRDDIEFKVDETAARSFGSQGQQRSAALAVKLAELQLVQRRVGDYPILMLDDVLSELDTDRARRLFQALPEGVQCIITTTDLDTHPEWFGADATYFHIHAGSLFDAR